MSRYQEALEGIVDLATAYDFESIPGSNYPRYYRNEDLFATEEARDEDIKLLHEAIDKAQKYDQLTEQLGCPVEVVIKALENGVWIENIYGEMVNFKVRLIYKNEELGYFFNFINDGYVVLKDYKKTWWLMK